MNAKTVPVLCIALCSICQTMQAQNYDTNGDYVQPFVGCSIPGYLDGQGQETEFSSPSQIVADTSSNLYVWDSGNRAIRQVTAGGTVSTLVPDQADWGGYGLPIRSFGAMAIDHSNTIWLVGFYSSYPYLFNITTNGTVVVAPGNLGVGATNLTVASGICFDSANNLYYSGGNTIYRCNPQTGVVHVFAGSGVRGYLDGNGIFTEFNFSADVWPWALACDQANNVYVWDSGNGVIRKIDQNGSVTTVAGTGSAYNGDTDGIGTNASFNSISAMTADIFGNVFMACGTCVFKMDASSKVSTIAGSFSQSSYANGAGPVARFSSASGLCLSQGTIFVSDSGNQRVRSITFNSVQQPLVAPNLNIAAYAGIQITGATGRTYQIQASTDMASWNTVAILLLTSSPYLWIDTTSMGGRKFYRVFLMP